MKIQDITIPDLVAGKVPSVMVSALRSNPDADYVAFDVGPFAAGIDAALASAGLSGKVKVIGQAADEAGIAALKAGKHTAWTGFDPVYSTYVMMDAMFRDSLGMPIDAESVRPADDADPDQGQRRRHYGKVGRAQGRARPVQEALGPLLLRDGNQ